MQKLQHLEIYVAWDTDKESSESPEKEHRPRQN